MDPILDLIDNVIGDTGGDAMRWAPDSDPSDSSDQAHCDDCSHYHWGYCPDRHTPCGDYRCCIN